MGSEIPPAASTSLSHSWEEKCAELLRELEYRRSVYPKWVAAGRMKPDVADRQISLLEAMVDDYCHWMFARSISREALRLELERREAEARAPAELV